VSRKREKKKDPGTDLIIHDLAAGTDATIAEVSDYIVTKDGNWVVYGVSSKTPEKDGAFARKIADGTTRTLLTGNGNYKSFTADASWYTWPFSATATITRPPPLSTSCIT